MYRNIQFIFVLILDVHVYIHVCSLYKPLNDYWFSINRLNEIFAYEQYIGHIAFMSTCTTSINIHHVSIHRVGELPVWGTDRWSQWIHVLQDWFWFVRRRIRFVSLLFAPTCTCQQLSAFMRFINDMHIFLVFFYS